MMLAAQLPRISTESPTLRRCNQRLSFGGDMGQVCLLQIPPSPGDKGDNLVEMRL